MASVGVDHTWEKHFKQRVDGTVECNGVVGLRSVSNTGGPALGTNARRVEMVDGTTPRHEATLADAKFDIKVASRSDSVDVIAFPEGAVEIEQHYYKGDVLEERYGKIDEGLFKDDVIKEVTVYKKEVDEIIKRDRVVNKIVEQVPRINYIDEIVEIEQHVETPVYKEVPIKKTIVKKIPKEVTEQRIIEKVRYIPVEEEKIVEKIIEIPGEIIVTPRHVNREECIVNDKHIDKEVPVVISQVVNPVMKDTKKKVRVPAKTLDPDLMTAQAIIPKPVQLEYHQGAVETTLKRIDLTKEEFNSAFFQLNGHLHPDHRAALVPNFHLYVGPDGFPLARDRNLKFWRLPHDAIDEIHDYYEDCHLIQKPILKATPTATASSTTKRSATSASTSVHSASRSATHSHSHRPVSVQSHSIKGSHRGSAHSISKSQEIIPDPSRSIRSQSHSVQQLSREPSKSLSAQGTVTRSVQSNHLSGARSHTHSVSHHGSVSQGSQRYTVQLQEEPKKVKTKRKVHRKVKKGEKGVVETIVDNLVTK